jgi:hypothetical protein
LIGFAALSLCGCNSQDNDHLRQIGRKLAVRIESLAGKDAKLGRGLEAIRNGWDEDSLEFRVSMRLRWDKELGNCKITVLREGAKVELSGVVPDAAAHQRAIDLAEATTGVESVADWLEEAKSGPDEKN